jgi:MFS family permease
MRLPRQCRVLLAFAAVAQLASCSDSQSGGPGGGVQLKDGVHLGEGVFAIDLAPLRESREYRLLYIGQSVSFFGTMMSFVALPWQLFQLTKSSFAVGMLGVVEFVAIFSMAFVGGALADYIDRRRMVRLTEIALAAGSLILITNSLVARPRAWVLFAAAVKLASRPDRLTNTHAVLIPGGKAGVWIASGLASGVTLLSIIVSVFPPGDSSNRLLFAVRPLLPRRGRWWARGSSCRHRRWRRRAWWCAATCLVASVFPPSPWWCRRIPLSNY